MKCDVLHLAGPTPGIQTLASGEKPGEKDKWTLAWIGANKKLSV